MKDNIKLKKIIDFLKSKKAERVIIIDLRGYAPFSDYFVIASANSTVHASALYKSLTTELKKNKIKIHHSEGETSNEWILIDCYDIVIHLFLPDKRDYYAIEDLFADRPVIEIGDDE